MAEMLGGAEVGCFGIVERGHHVPCRPSPQQQVHGREYACDMGGLIIGGGAGHADAEMFGSEAQGEGVLPRVKLGSPDAVAECGGHVVAVSVGNRQTVVEKG